MPPPRGSFNPIEGPGDYTTTAIVHNDTYEAIDPRKTNDYIGKSVFIAGASRGIGKAVALSYAKAGASQIAIGARSDLTQVEKEMLAAAKDAGRAEPKVLWAKMDVTNEESVGGAVARIGEAFDGKLDVLVIVAGVLDGRGEVVETEVDGWWKNFEVNVRGPYLVSRACIPLLLAGSLKTLITVSSVGALCVSPTLSGYQISKLAVLRLTEFIAKEYFESGLTAIIVHPGNILTEIVGFGEGFDEKMKAVFTETPELCADSLVFLSRERRQWLSGRYVNVTWDLPELVGAAKRKEIVDGDRLKIRLVI